jgi:hypothetical protein
VTRPREIPIGSRNGLLETVSPPYLRQSSAARPRRVVDVRCHGCGREYSFDIGWWGVSETCRNCKPPIGGWNKLTNELLDQVIALREADIPDSEIAKKIGCHRSAILRRLGPNGRPHGQKPIHILDADGNPPSCPNCGCCPMYLQPSTGNFQQCCRCSFARGSHGFKSHREYDDFLSQGCFVCSMPADRVDHNHENGCPKRDHSCMLCRRGPICATCNNLLVEGVTVDGLFINAKKYQALADANYRAAEALAKLELTV